VDPAPLKCVWTGEVVCLRCALCAAGGDDLQFLFGQTLGGRRHKNISTIPPPQGRRLPLAQ